MAAEIDELIGHSNAPNLYNALTDLPVPFIGFRTGLQGERIMLYGTFPGLYDSAIDLEAGSMTATQIEECVTVLLRFNDDKKNVYSDRKTLAQAILAKHEVAKKALIASGRPREKVEAMPHVQVALLHSLLEYDTLLDQVIMWHNLPYWESAARFKDLETMNRKEREADPSAPAIALTQLSFPDTERAAFLRAKLDRKIALLRTVEALRVYAAEHDRKLPRRLADIKEVPVPIDPMTGAAFEYELDGDVAHLRASAPAKATPSVDNSVTYELRIRK
jgi:hypothetical protein